MPIELISTFRKKINITFLIVLLSAIIVLCMPLMYRIVNQEILLGKKILSYFLVFYFIALYERRKNLFRIFKSDPDLIIPSFENYLKAREQKSHKLTIIRIVIMGILTVGAALDLFVFSQKSWSGFFITIWFAVVLLFIAEYWLNMNTHIMLQDLKHSNKDHHSEISE